jgi:hypothetical protein
VTKHEITFWLRQQLAVGRALLPAYATERTSVWHTAIADAVDALACAQAELRRELGHVDVPPEPDHNAPYICMGCRLVYTECPDPNAYDCPACGEKVCPVRLWRRRVLACDKAPCDGGTTFYRCDGGMRCTTCGLRYYDHPFCKNSAHPSTLSDSSFPEYALHVLCNGDHIKT